MIKAKTYQYTFFMSDKGFSGCPLIISPGFSYLLLHFPRAQPHDVPQLLPVDRHWHFVVLHSDFLLQEQHSSLSVIFFTLSCWCSSPAESNCSQRLLLPKLGEVWSETSWWLTIFKYQKVIMKIFIISFRIHRSFYA